MTEFQDKLPAQKQYPSNKSGADESASSSVSLDRAYGSDELGAFRRVSLHELLASEIPKEVAKVTTFPSGVAIVIPTHHDKNKDRIKTITTALKSIHDQVEQGFAENLQIVISDNGITPDMRQALEERLRGFKLNYTIVNAQPKFDLHKNAAYARNIAFRELQVLAQTNRDYYANVLLLDDDAALLPNALEILNRTLKGQESAVAVKADIIPTPDLKEGYDSYMEYQSPQMPQAGFSHKRAVLMPKLHSNMGFDIASVIAFSGQITTKTTCLLLDRLNLDRLVVKSGNVLLRYPNGSFEDMALGAVLSRHGDIFHAPDAQALDQVPPEQEKLLLQKSRWGGDHVTALADFVEVGHIKPGIHILEPGEQNGQPVWVEWSIPVNDRTIVVINPAQIKQLRVSLKEQVQEGLYNILGPAFAKSELNAADRALGSTLRFIAESKNSITERRIRDDLPPPAQSIPDQPRWSSEVAAFQLAGNLAAMRTFNHISKGELPKIAVFGVRQYARWAGGK